MADSHPSKTRRERPFFARPSTTYLRKNEDVDARHKAGQRLFFFPSPLAGEGGELRADASDNERERGQARPLAQLAPLSRSRSSARSPLPWGEANFRLAACVTEWRNSSLTPPRQTPGMLAPATESSRTYDLCINIAGRRLYWRNRNHGVTLGPGVMNLDDGRRNKRRGVWRHRRGASQFSRAESHFRSLHHHARRRPRLADRQHRSGRLFQRRPEGAVSRFCARPAPPAPCIALSRHPLHRRLELVAVPRRCWRCPRSLRWSRPRSGSTCSCTSASRAALFCWGSRLTRAGSFYRTALNNTPRDYTPDRLPDFLLS